METVRLNINYRPLRVCWAIESGDFDAFREAVRNNHALWGGRFNPIVVIDRDVEARAIIEAFRVDVIAPLGSHGRAKKFAASFENLSWPFFQDDIFRNRALDGASAVLDVINAMLFARDTSELKEVRTSSPRIYKWDSTDPLHDVLLMQLGAYPDKDVIHIDYESAFEELLGASEVTIEPNTPLPADLFDYPTIAYLSRYKLYQRSSGTPYAWSRPGFYLGDSSNLDDMVAFWNLRAANLTLMFVDQPNSERYTAAIAAFQDDTRETLQGSQYKEMEYPVWSRGPHDDFCKNAVPSDLFGGRHFRICSVTESLWGEHGVRPPVMELGETNALAVLTTEGSKPKISFSLSDRPYSSSSRFHSQHLVASVRPVGLTDQEDFTFSPPCVPDLTEFYARGMYYFYNRLRVESERIALIVDATTTDDCIWGLSTSGLFEQIFKLAGFDASISSGGLIARQLIAQLGGLQGGRVFKIPGARTLLKTHGPLSSFTKRGALQLISKNSDDPSIKFSEYADLYLEYRPSGEKLTPEKVFTYLVNKRLFRIGHDLNCPHCQLKSWFSIDELRQHVNCQMCGKAFDAAAQLVAGEEWAYRRSGVLGAERNAQGAVPVVLTLQQLDTTFQVERRRLYSVSLDLRPTRGKHHGKCEVDFAWLIPRRYREKTVVIIGECKDSGQSPARRGDGGTINANDIANLRLVADSFPSDRFQVFVLLAKLCAFTPTEIELAKSLNEEHQERVIMLTERELEPYFLFERTAKLFKIEKHGSFPEDLARATAAIYFDAPPIDPEARSATS